jgi:hypothetical protein
MMNMWLMPEMEGNEHFHRTASFHDKKTASTILTLTLFSNSRKVVKEAEKRISSALEIELRGGRKAEEKS